MRCGSVDARPDPGGGAGWPCAHVRVSVAWSGRRARGFSAVAARVRALGSAGPGPRGRGALARGRERRAGSRGRSEAAPASRSGLRWLGKAATRCLPAASRHRGGGGRAQVSDARVHQSTSQLSFLGSGTQSQTGSVGGSSGGSLEMLMGKETSPLPSLPLCKCSPALRCWRRGASRANRGRRYLCSIRRDLGAGGTGLEDAVLLLSAKLPLRQLRDSQAVLMQAPASPWPSCAGIWTPLGSDGSVLVTAVFTLISVSLKSSVWSLRSSSPCRVVFCPTRP